MTDNHIDKEEPKDDNLTIGAKGGAIAFILKVAATSLLFLNQIILARFLGAGGLGEVFLAISVVNISSQFGRFGMESAMMRFIPIYVENGNNAKLKGTIYFALKMCVFLAIIFVFIVLVFSRHIALNLFHAEGLLKLLPLAAVAIPASVIRGVVGGILKGYKDSFRALMPEFLVLPVLRIGVFLLLTIKGVSPLYAIIAFAAGELVAVFVSIYFLVTKLNLLGNVKRECENRNVVDVASTVMFTGISTLLFTQGNIWIVGMYVSTEAVGIYGVAAKLIEFVTFSLMAFSTIIPPIIASVYSSNNRDELKKVVSKSARWILSISVPIILILVLEGKFILENAFGGKFVDAYVALVILAVGQLINAGSGLVGLLLQMTGKHKTLMRITLCWGVVSIILNIILVPRLGIVGAAISTAFCLAMVNIVSVFTVYNRLSLLALATGIKFDIIFTTIVAGLYAFCIFNNMIWGHHVLLMASLMIYMTKSIINDDFPHKLVFSAFLK